MKLARFYDYYGTYEDPKTQETFPVQTEPGYAPDEAEVIGLCQTCVKDWESTGEDTSGMRIFLGPSGNFTFIL